METLLNSVVLKMEEVKRLATPEAIKFVEQCIQMDNQNIYEKNQSLKQAIMEKDILLGKTNQTLDQLPKNTLQSLKAKPIKPVDNAKSGNNKAPSVEAPIDIGRLDFRIGRILEVSHHPDADSLYVEKVDLGNNDIRTVVSGLVKFVALEELQNRVGIFMCNLKPVKMRGVESQAMLMCASDLEGGSVEPLIVEGENVQLGDSVIVSGYDHNPDVQLNPKKKIFEQIKPDLRVNDSGLATYKNSLWTLKSCPKAIIKSRLNNVQIS